MPDDTPDIDFSRLSFPFPNAAKLIAIYRDTGRLPDNLFAARAAIVAACDRMLSHQDLPPAWRDDVLAIRLEHSDGPRTIKRVRK